MIKKDKQGFMMAELIVVSSIVLVVLSALYVSYSKLYGLYKTRLSYYDSTTLYRLGYYRDILIENSLINDLLVDTKNKRVISVYDSKKNGQEGANLFTLPSSDVSYEYNDRVFIVYTGKNTINKDILNGQTNINATFNDYVTFLSTSAEIKSNYILLMERCKISNINDCKYEYLEVYDGKE